MRADLEILLLEELLRALELWKLDTELIIYAST